MRKALALVFASSCLVSAANAAGDDMRPGLWEITATSDLLWFVPQIPSEQMQNLKDLAEQYGVDLPQIRMGDAVSKACITPEMAQQKELPIFYQSELGCSSRNASRSGSRYRLEFTCSNPQLQGNGTAEGTLTGPENFTGRTTFDGTVQGRPVNEHADISGRWLSSSCGTVKPL